MPDSNVTRRKVLQGAASAVAASILPGCSSGSGSSTMTTPPAITPPAASNPQPNPGTPFTSATLGITAVATGTIGPQFIGLSYDKTFLNSVPEFYSTNTNLAALFKLINVGVLRFGDGSNDVWTPAGKGQTAGQTSQVDVNNLAGFLKASACQCLYGINLGGYGPVGTAYPTTPTLAQEETSYVSQQLGSSLYGIEIGNEPDAYINTFFAGLSPKWNVADLEAAWKTFYNAIIAGTPGIPITGPACGTVLPVITVWTEPFATAEATYLNVLTQHYYRANGQSSPLPTVAQLVTPDTQLTGSFLAPLQSTSQSIGKPYRISVCNSYYNGGATGVSDSYASSLWVIDFMYNCAQYGSQGVNFHGGSNLNYTAIIDNNGTVTGVRPLYYGILMFALAGQGTLYTCNLNAGSLNATAYAVKTSAGLNIIINNKDSAQNLDVTITVPQTVNTATLMVMTQATSGISGPSLAALSGVTIQGATVSASGGFVPGAPYTLSTGSSQLTCYVPYLSAVLIHIT